jgi:hypothetical protein
MSLLFITGYIHSQPVLNSTCNPFDGLSLKTVQLEGAPELTEGSYQSWDLSDVSMDESDWNIDYVECSSGSDQYTCIKEEFYGGFAYNRFQVSNEDLKFVKYWEDGNSTVYPDPMTIMKYPTSYGDLWEDSYVAQVAAGEILTWYGSNVVEVTGWGTLKIANNTFYNVLLLKRVRLDSDGNPQYMNLELWTNDVGHSLVEQRWTVEMIDDEYIGVSPIWTRSIDLATSDRFPGTQIQVSPNPVIDHAQIYLAHPENFDELRLINEEGRTLFSIPVLGRSVIDIDMRHLSSGMYILKTDKEEQLTFKITKTTQK